VAVWVWCVDANPLLPSCAYLALLVQKGKQVVVVQGEVRTRTIGDVQWVEHRQRVGAVEALMGVRDKVGPNHSLPVAFRARGADLRPEQQAWMRSFCDALLPLCNPELRRGNHEPRELHLAPSTSFASPFPALSPSRCSRSVRMERTAAANERCYQSHCWTMIRERILFDRAHCDLLVQPGMMADAGTGADIRDETIVLVPASAWASLARAFGPEVLS
jgi:hypothetical protein